MKPISFTLIGMLFALSSVFSQELFPVHEPASNIPKGVFGIRGVSESFKEIALARNQFAAKIMYGITANWEVEAQTDFSNHHASTLPVNLVSHSHFGNRVYYFTNNKTYGIEYPYTFGGIYLYSKYRIFSMDRAEGHLRAALFAEYSTTRVAHDEAEPDLQGDTGGEGGGFVVTWLLHKMAVSLTTGFILPNDYKETRDDYRYNPPYFKTDLSYGRAAHFDLSFGYLLVPKQYDSYSNLNINLYAEFEGKAYEAAKIIQNDSVVNPISSALLKGFYVDFFPGIQFIFNSNTRIDLSIGFSFYNHSYSHFNPIYSWGIQRYIFVNSHKAPKVLKQTF